MVISLVTFTWLFWWLPTDFFIFFTLSGRFEVIDTELLLVILMRYSKVWPILLSRTVKNEILDFDCEGTPSLMVKKLTVGYLLIDFQKKKRTWKCYTCCKKCVLACVILSYHSSLTLVLMFTWHKFGEHLWREPI